MGSNIIRSLKERFDEAVEVLGPDDCWPWRWSCDPYGVLSIKGSEPGSRRNLLAHRLAWEFAFGPIPDGFDVLHSCDNPPCCNPSHLFLGTQLENMKDKVAKGRTHGKGTGSIGIAKSSKLIDLILQGYTTKTIIKELGVCSKTISSYRKKYTELL